MSRIVGRRGPTDTGWHWCVVDDPPRRRSRRWLTAVPVLLIAALLVFAASLGGQNNAAGNPQSCGDTGLSVNGTLTGSISFCAPAGTTVSQVIGVIAVHYPGNENPCGFLPEPGPGGSWFRVPGNYQLALSGGPPVPGPVTSADWSYSFGGSFSLCGGENSMRVTIVVITNLAGATAWAADFGPGAYGVRTGSFKPELLVAPTPTPGPSATPTPPATPTPSPSPTASPAPTPTPSPAASPTPTASPAPTPSPAPSATPSPAGAPSPTPTGAATASPTPTASPAPTALTQGPTPTRTPISPAVLERSATPVRSPALPATGGRSGGGPAALWLFLLLGAGLALAGLVAVAASRTRRAGS